VSQIMGELADLLAQEQATFSHPHQD